LGVILVRSQLAVRNLGATYETARLLRSSQSHRCLIRVDLLIPSAEC